MKTTVNIKIALLLSLLLSLTACTSYVMDYYSVISIKPFPFENKDMPSVRGDDCAFVYFSHTGIPSIERALKDALKKANADYLTDVKIYSHGKFYFFWAKNCVVVEGKPGGIKPSAVYKRPAAYSPYTTQIRPLPALPSYLLPKSISQ